MNTLAKSATKQTVLLASWNWILTCDRQVPSSFNCRICQHSIGSIPTKCHQQIRDGATLCSEIRHQQTWQLLLCYRHAIPPRLEFPETRRKEARLCMLFKIKHELVTISKSDRLVKSQNSHNATLGNNNFIALQSKCYYRKELFFPRTIRDWSRLTSRHCVSRVAWGF